MKKKIIRRELNEAGHPLTHHSLHPILQRVYQTRGIKSLHELEHHVERLLPFQELLGMQDAVKCLASALCHQQKILIVGDFDADGATSSAVAVRALRSFGALYVNFLVPNRFAFGYGLTPEIVNVAKNEFDPALIVTVDNGISNFEGVIAAKKWGMQVVITDHHLAGETLPPADAIVNPNQPNDPFPSKHIAGVGVIFYVMVALRRHLSNIGWFEQQGMSPPNMSRLLDIVALGTVADVVSLDQNNRILVHQGLRRIRSGYCIPGITALLEIAGRNQARTIATDLGFAVAPRLNAAGRLEDMSLGIECLITDDINQAREIAQRLDQLNLERRVIESDMQDQAFSALNALQFENKNLPMGICLFNPSWHQGVIGILASRVKDKLHRPVIAFALANDHELKGSARSILGIHIRDVLCDITMHHPNLIQKFGGHALAAGLSISRHDFETFTQVFADNIAMKMNDQILNHVLLSDGELFANELTIEVAEILREAGPWGQSFPEPIFDGRFEIIEQRIVGSKHLKMVLSKDNQLVDAIAFNIDLASWPNHRCHYVNIAYRMDVNEFRGKKNVQLVVEHLETA